MSDDNLKGRVTHIQTRQAQSEQTSQSTATFTACVTGESKGERVNDSLQLTLYTVQLIIIMSASPGSTIRSFICESLTPTAQHKSSVRKPGQLCELNADTHNEEQPDIIKSFKPVRNRERKSILVFIVVHFLFLSSSLYILKHQAISELRLYK